jgi:hypothetical protein
MQVANRIARVWHPGRQKMVLERWTNPKISRRSCSTGEAPSKNTASVCWRTHADSGITPLQVVEGGGGGAVTVRAWIPERFCTVSTQHTGAHHPI